MTTHISPRTRIAGGALLVAAVLLGVQACGVESPLAEGDGAREGAVTPVAESERQPAEGDRTAVGDDPGFTPFTDPPQITNRSEVIDALEREYPPLLREAGIGGTVRVYFHISATGEVAEARIDISSGHEALDRAALRVADAYRFTPALNRDQTVPVWVSFPITFRPDA